MAKFTPFGGRGLFYFNNTGDDYWCSFCSKKFKAFQLYETHWPICSGASLSKERPFKPFEMPAYPRFPSSFKRERVPMSRLYVGRLPRDVRERDIERLFKGYGQIRDICLLSGFGFVEFRDRRDAEDVMHDFNNREFMGERLLIEPARVDRRRDRDDRGGFGRRDDDRGGFGRRDDRDDRGARRMGGGAPQRTPYRLLVENLSSSVSWQRSRSPGFRRSSYNNRSRSPPPRRQSRSPSPRSRSPPRDGPSDLPPPPPRSRSRSRSRSPGPGPAPEANPEAWADQPAPAEPAPTEPAAEGEQNGNDGWE
ncbi:Serine/arginine-rich splicing factor 6 [Dipsacomyces acuminosporus]|nr:Serine/arginine-rich splicing factor 6 [Dipsacomyces acuminosporus]